MFGRKRVYPPARGTLSPALAASVEPILEQAVKCGLLRAWSRLETPVRHGGENKFWSITEGDGYTRMLGDDWSAPNFVIGLQENPKWKPITTTGE